MHRSISDVFFEHQIYTSNCLCDTSTWKPPRHLKCSVHIGLMFTHAHVHMYTHTHLYSFSIISYFSKWHHHLFSSSSQKPGCSPRLPSPPHPHSQHSPSYSALYFLILSSSLTLHCQAPSSPYLDHSTNLLTRQQLSPLPPQSFLPSAAKVTSENAILTQYFSDLNPLVAFY